MMRGMGSKDPLLEEIETAALTSDLAGVIDAAVFAGIWVVLLLCAM